MRRQVYGLISDQHDSLLPAYEQRSRIEDFAEARNMEIIAFVADPDEAMDHFAAGFTVLRWSDDFQSVREVAP